MYFTALFKNSTSAGQSVNWSPVCQFGEIVPSKIIGDCRYAPTPLLVYGYYAIAAAELFIELLFVGIE